MQTASVGSADLAGWLTTMYDQQFHLSKAVYDGLIGAPLFGEAGDIVLNGPLWTLRIELWSSIGLFALYYVFGRKRFALALLIFVALCFCSRTPLYFLPFALGAMIAHLEKHLVRYRHVAAIMLAAGIFFGAYEYSPAFLWLPGGGIHDVTIAHIAYLFDPRTLYNDIGGMLVVAGVIGCTPVASLLASKPLAYLGRISFGIYLLHWPIFFSLSIWLVIFAGNQGVSHLLAVSISFFVTLAIVLFAATIFHQWVDLPSCRLADWVARTANPVKRADQARSAL
jgi:peptidoglycan/LPS O-acetylase OafA/YrhL